MRRIQKNSKRKAKRKTKKIPPKHHSVLPNLEGPLNTNSGKPDVKKPLGDKLPPFKVGGKESSRKERINERYSQTREIVSLPIITNKENQDIGCSSKVVSGKAFSSREDGSLRIELLQQKIYPTCARKVHFDERKQKSVPSNIKEYKEKLPGCGGEKSSQRTDRYLEIVQPLRPTSYGEKDVINIEKKQKHSSSHHKDELKRLPSEQEKFKSIPRKILKPLNNYSLSESKKNQNRKDSVVKNMKHQVAYRSNKDESKNNAELRCCIKDISEEKQKCVNLIGVENEQQKYVPSELENMEDGRIDKWEGGVFEKGVAVDLSNNKTGAKGKDEIINKNKEVITTVENKESGLNLSKESGTSASLLTIDEKFCEQDVIFEEVIDMDFIQSHQRAKQRAKLVAKNTVRKPLNMKNLESGLQVNKDRRSLLSTKEFKVEGLEIDLRKLPPNKKAKKTALSSSKPKICSQKMVMEGKDGIQGCKVKGCSVDMDEYVIAMVRLVNCNDNVNHDEKRVFPCRLFQEFL